MQRAAKDSLRISGFGGHDDFERVIRRDVDIATHKVHKVSSLQQHLRQPGIVVILFRNMAIAARLCLLAAHSVRHVRVECLTGKALGGSSLLLRINPFAVLILRAHQHGGRRTHGSDAIAGNGPVATEHENIIAQNLEVVFREVA